MQRPRDNVHFRQLLSQEFPSGLWSRGPLIPERFTMVTAEGLPTELIRTRILLMQLGCTILSAARPNPDSADGYGDYITAQASSDRTRCFGYKFITGSSGTPVMSGGYTQLDRGALPGIIDEAANGTLLLDPRDAAEYVESLLRHEDEDAIALGKQLFANEQGLAILSFDS